MKTKRELKKLTFAAMLTALCIVIGWVCKAYLTVTPSFRITFENLPLLLCGFMLGPVWGAVAGVASDLISCVLSGYGVNPIITLGAASVGAVAGAFSQYIYNRKVFPRVLLASVTAHVFGSMLIKSLGMYLLYDIALPVLALRIPLYAVISVIEAYLCYVVLKNKRIGEPVR